MHPAHITN